MVHVALLLNYLQFQHIILYLLLFFCLKVEFEDLEFTVRDFIIIFQWRIKCNYSIKLQYGLLPVERSVHKNRKMGEGKNWRLFILLFHWAQKGNLWHTQPK